MKSLYTLQEVMDCASKLSLKVTPEEIFNYWEEKGWKTKKGTFISSLHLAINVANGTINYVKNKDFYKKKEKQLALERKGEVSKAIKERVKPKSKPYQKYKDQLNRPEWLAFRQFIFAVRGKECEVCGCKHELQVHHLRYFENRRAWEYTSEDVMVLCKNCHRTAHGL